MRVKQEEDKYSILSKDIGSNRPLPSAVPKDDGRRREEDIKKKEEEKLAEFRKQQYWEMRKQAEMNRRRVESQLYDGTDSSQPPKSGRLIDDSVAEKQVYAEEKRRQERLSKMKANNVIPKQDDNNNNGYRSNILIQDHQNQYNQKSGGNLNNSILKTMKNVVGDIKNLSRNDDDDIFTCENEQEEESPALPNKFKIMGKTLMLEGTKDNDSLNFRIEALRKYLEESLGDDILLRVYKLLRREDLNEGIIDSQVSLVIGQKQGYIPLIHQLIFCEDILNDHQLS